MFDGSKFDSCIPCLKPNCSQTAECGLIKKLRQLSEGREWKVTLRRSTYPLRNQCGRRYILASWLPGRLERETATLFPTDFNDLSTADVRQLLQY